MRSLRNLAFVLFVLAGLGVAERTQALAEDWCPQSGCDCGWSDNHYIVDCWQVYDCQETYPSFCDDFYNACYNRLCAFVTSYSCEDFGGCWAECVCGIAQ